MGLTIIFQPIVNNNDDKRINDKDLKWWGRFESW